MNARAVNKLLERFGFQLKKTKALEQERAHYISIIDGARKIFETHKNFEGKTLNNGLSGLVFSKDRAMQLHALLISYADNVRNPCPLTVLYKATSKRSREAYEVLKKELPGLSVQFVEETDFHEQVKRWLKTQVADRIFFMTDDAIFLDRFDINDVLHFNPLLEIVSLTKGKDLLYSFTMDVAQELPSFIEKNVGGKGFNSWIWADCPQSPDWSYPLSVDVCFYLRQEILCITENIAFNNPNTLEANMQLYKPFFLKRKGICYDKVKLINVPCNLVQSNFKNRSTGHFNAEELLGLWEDGKRINTKKFYGLAAFDAEHAKYEFCEKIAV